MEWPPGEPVTMNKSLSLSKTRIGDMDERGRLPGAIALATARPSVDGLCAKSVNSLLRRNPPAQRDEPNGA